MSSYLTFSPLPDESGGYSLLRYSTLTDSFPLRSMVLCVARTFLTPEGERQTGSTGSSGLPSDVGRATLIMSVYMTLQLLRRTARHVTMRLVGSYPTFSPLPRFP